MQKLITAKEVIYSSDVDRNYPVDLIERQLPWLEVGAFDDSTYHCGGTTFRDHLLTKLSDPTGEEYDGSETYASGDMVWSDGQYYESQVNGNTERPVSLNGWALVPKFTDPALEELWLHFMRPWLASYIVVRTLATTTYRAGNRGVTVYLEDKHSQMGASKSQLESLKGEMWQKVGYIYKQMIDHIWRQHDAGDYDYSGLGIPRSGVERRDEGRRTRVSFRY